MSCHHHHYLCCRHHHDFCPHHQSTASGPIGKNGEHVVRRATKARRDAHDNATIPRQPTTEGSVRAGRMRLENARMLCVLVSHRYQLQKVTAYCVYIYYDPHIYCKSYTCMYIFKKATEKESNRLVV